ncbi:MAG: Succinate dehydrogenase flavoprotein subunit, partial [uncultured Phycisphaerae bacterium]
GCSQQEARHRRRRRAGRARLHDQAGGRGRRRRPVLDDPGAAQPQRVRAGRDQRVQRHRAAAGLQRVDALRRDRARRRLPGGPAAGAGDVQLGAEDHRPARPDGGAVQPHARGAAGAATFWRVAVQADVLRRGDDGAAVAVRAGRADAAVGGGGARQQVRVLGVPLAGDPRWALHGNRGPGHAHHGDPRVPRRRGRDGDRRQRADLRQEHDVGHLYRRRDRPLLPGGRALRQPGDDPGPPDRHPGRGQVPADLRVRPRRGRPGLGSPQGRRHPPPQRHPGGRAVLLPRGAVPEVRQHRPARHRNPRDLRGLPAGPRRRRREHGLPRPPRHYPPDRPGQGARQARGHPRDLREVRRHRPARRADEDLPRRPLHDGRPLGRLRE